jgi:plasmid stabilization system protein ParE
MRVRLTKVATRQLDALLAYVARENPAAGQRIAARIDEIRDFLGRNPHAGYKLSRGRLRRFPVRPFPYLIYFEASGQTVRIIRIRHAAQYRRAFHEAAFSFQH